VKGVRYSRFDDFSNQFGRKGREHLFGREGELGDGNSNPSCMYSKQCQSERRRVLQTQALKEKKEEEEINDRSKLT
jgi:hypothetical protein